MIKSIVLVSGGMDSLVTAAIAGQESDELYFLHLNYHQRTYKKEQECFHKLVEFYNPSDVLEIEVDYLKKIGGSSLTDESMEIKDHDHTGEVPSSYVPFRNAHLLAIATSWGEVIKADRIYIGAVEEDSSGYPDCWESFFKAMERSISLGTKAETVLEIRTPVIHMTKAGIVELGNRLKVPFQYSWSCYRNNDLACGTCDSCVLRIRAFELAGIVDPIPYEVNK